VDFTPSDQSRELRERLAAFMDECVYPAEAVYARGRATSFDPHHVPPVVEDLKVEARSRGLWNLFLPGVSGLSNVEYAPLAELMGRSPVLAAEACNCSAPDTGNMELLHMFGAEEQKRRWLDPLLEGEIRSCFAMTEPDVASSDATNIAARIERADRGRRHQGRGAPGRCRDHRPRDPGARGAGVVRRCAARAAVCHKPRASDRRRPRRRTP
jgi:acyl-CoA dehydrogenase